MNEGVRKLHDCLMLPHQLCLCRISAHSLCILDDAQLFVLLDRSEMRRSHSVSIPVACFRGRVSRLVGSALRHLSVAARRLS